MRVKRSGQAAKLRRRRWGIMALVLAGLALCLLAALPVQAARNTQKHCFPLDTTAWRVSDAYGARTDPFTGKSAFHRGLDLACAAGTAVQAVQDGVVTAAAYSPSYGQPSAHPAPGWLRDPLRTPAIPLCPPGRGGAGRADAGHSRADRPRHRCAPASGTVAAGRCLRPAALLENAP